MKNNVTAHGGGGGADRFIKSPLNYTGGKYKILGQIIPLFPQRIHNFVDLFAGGLNVGINADAEKIYANDHNSHIVELFRYFQGTELDEILSSIKDCIAEFNLTKMNADGYIQLRNSYNKEKSSLKLFVLICYSFNHQIRFNANGEFNVSFRRNRSSYNSAIEQNLKRFVYALQEKEIILTNKDFADFDFSVLEDEDFVYCDPPYLIATASYNEQKGWTEADEKALLNLLDDLNEKNIYFALSNVFSHKGRTNELLIDWSRKYHVHHISRDYSNCSYHGKNRDSTTDEVLITNFFNKEH